MIKPRLIIQAMCKAQLKLDEAELKKIYDALYGEKIQVQGDPVAEGDRKKTCWCTTDP